MSLRCRPSLVFSAQRSQKHPQSFNLYSYALNNPLINTDPTGMYCDYSDHDDPSSGFDPSQFDYHSNSGECGDNGGQWVDDAYTQDGADQDGRPEEAVATNTDSGPSADVENRGQTGCSQSLESPRFTTEPALPNILGWPLATVPATPPNPNEGATGPSHLGTSEFKTSEAASTSAIWPFNGICRQFSPSGAYWELAWVSAGPSPLRSSASFQAERRTKLALLHLDRTFFLISHPRAAYSTFPLHPSGINR
jgi:hypothetical protein